MAHHCLKVTVKKAQQQCWTKNVNLSFTAHNVFPFLKHSAKIYPTWFFGFSSCFKVNTCHHDHAWGRAMALNPLFPYFLLLSLHKFYSKVMHKTELFMRLLMQVRFSSYCVHQLHWTYQGLRRNVLIVTCLRILKWQHIWNKFIFCFKFQNFGSGVHINYSKSKCTDWVLHIKGF